MIGADALLLPAERTRIAARRVLLARDDAARAARIVRVSDDPAEMAALPPGSVIVPAEQWQTLFYACQALARVAGVDLARPES